MKDLLLRARVVVRISKMKISRRRLPGYVKTLHHKACRTCSTARIFFSIQPIKLLIFGVVVDVAAVKSWTTYWYCKGRIQLNWLLNQIEFLVIFRISKDLKTGMSQNSLCLQNLLNHSFLVMSESFQMTPRAQNLWGLRCTDALLNNFHHILVSSSELCRSIVHCLILIFGLFWDLTIDRQFI